MKSPKKYSSKSSCTWQLQEAKACFSEVVRRAKDRPQRVTVRGEEAVVILSVEEYEKKHRQTTGSLDELMANSPLKDIEFDRKALKMPVREIEL